MKLAANDLASDNESVLSDIQTLRKRGRQNIEEGAVTRGYAEQPVVNVSVMCRDVAYALPGQERGRFSACQGADGQWMLARTDGTSAAGAI